MHPLLSDPFVAAEIDDALAPYAGLPAEELAWMRERLADVLATDPHAAAILSGAHPRVVDTSGAVEALAPASEPAKPDVRRRGKAG
jgi:hypothetical protein